MKNKYLILTYVCLTLPSIFFTVRDICVEYKVRQKVHKTLYLDNLYVSTFDYYNPSNRVQLYQKQAKSKHCIEYDGHRPDRPANEVFEGLECFDSLLGPSYGYLAQ